LVSDADISVPLQLAENLARAIRAAIVDNEYLFRDRDSDHAPYQFANPLPFVVNRDDYGELEAAGDRVNPQLAADGFTE
jgi:hypothetical protein